MNEWWELCRFCGMLVIFEEKKSLTAQKVKIVFFSWCWFISLTIAFFFKKNHSSSLRHSMKILKSLYKWFAECKTILFYYFPKKFWIICMLYSFFRHWRVTSPEKEKEIPPLRVVSQSCVSLSLTKYRAGIKGCN